MKRSRIPPLVLAATLVFLYLPLLAMAVHSFNASRFGGEWTGFTLKWYERLAQERVLLRSLSTSLIVASVATLVAAVFGTLSALALHRYRGRVQGAHLTLLTLPLVVPDVLMGLSLMVFFVATSTQLGVGTIVVAHVTFCISFVAMVVLARLQDFDFSVIEAARDLGATATQATAHVMLPLLAPGIVAGALLSFTLSIDDFVITFFVAGPGSTTLPIYIFSSLKHGSPPVIQALSVVMLAATAVVAWLVLRLARRST
ncbi:MAG: ABC transporter permease [Myxococcales bacterium]